MVAQHFNIDIYIFRLYVHIWTTSKAEPLSRVRLRLLFLVNTPFRQFRDLTKGR